MMVRVGEYRGGLSFPVRRESNQLTFMGQR